MLSENKIYRIVKSDDPNCVVQLDESALPFGDAVKCRVSQRSSSPAQLFRFISAGSGNKYYIQSYANSRCFLGIHRSVFKSESGSVIGTWYFVFGSGYYSREVFPLKRKWQITAMAGNPGVVQLSCADGGSEFSNLVLDVEDNTVYADYSLCFLKEKESSKAHQKWRIEEVATDEILPYFFPGNDNRQLYRFSPANNPDCILDVSCDKKYYFCGIATRNSTDFRQLFIRQDNADGSFCLFAANEPSMALTALANTERGSVVMAPYEENWGSQKWILGSAGNDSSILKCAFDFGRDGGSRSRE